MSSKVETGKKESGYRKVMNWAKKRYSLISDLDVWLVFTLFAITGSTSVKIARPFLALIGVTDAMNPWLFWSIRILVVFIVYQLLFVTYGYLLGLIRKPVWGFAWWFEQKMLSRFGIKFKS